METSDSDYFESADEDIQSDDEDTKTVKDVPKTKELDKEDMDENVKHLNNLKLTEKQKDSDFVNLDTNKNKDNNKVLSIQKDEENNVNVCENLPEDRSRKNSTKKLGTKLPKKADNSGEQIDNPVSQEVAKADVEEDLWDDSEIDWGKENDDTNMWTNDDWEPVEQSKPSEEKLTPTSTSWGSWGNWGVSSILSTASQSVSTLTQGITTVLETGIGVPEPEELARINKAEKEKIKEIPQEESDNHKSGFGLGDFVMGVSHLTKLVESTGTKVISGGLDTLETIGKKTMEVLQEGDPGLKKKRAFLKIDQDKPVLSQLLREAKEKAEKENKILEEQHFAKKSKNYETLFDDHQGLVHLEALEMLSKQCDIKLQTLLESYTDDALIDMQETMDQVKELCELPDEDEDEQANFAELRNKLETAVAEINIPISYKKLIETWEETETWLNNLKLEICDEKELHQQAIETLAQLTAMGVEQFHKTGELLLVKERRSTADEADSLVQLTTTLTSLIGVVAAKFSDKLNAKSSNSRNKEEINGLITNVFYEAANSSSYIQDAFQLLIPVLQVGAV